MGWKFSTTIKTEAAFKFLLNALLSDLGRVNDYLTLYQNLLKAQEGPQWRGMAGALAFWSTIYRALDEAALDGLASTTWVFRR